MNACPHCQQTYEDWVEFCFEDGTPLVARTKGRPVVAEQAHPDSTVPNGPIPGRASAAAARSLVAFEDDADDDPTVPAVPYARERGTLDSLDTEEMSLADAPTVELPASPNERVPAPPTAPRDAAPQAVAAVPAPRRAAPHVARAKAAPERPVAAPAPAAPPAGVPRPAASSAARPEASVPAPGWRPSMPILVAGGTVVLLAAVLGWALTPAPDDAVASDEPHTTSAAAGDAAAVLASPSTPDTPAPTGEGNGADDAGPRRGARRDGPGARGPSDREDAPSDARDADRAQETGRLLITSRPDGATVSVDGKTVGTTPMDADVSYGSHTIRVELDGYKPETREVGIHTRKLPLPFVLQPTMRTGVVRLSAPGAAQVLVDGSDVGVLPARLTLNEGTHEFQVVGVDPRGSCTKRLDVTLGGASDVALTVRCP